MKSIKNIILFLLLLVTIYSCNSHNCENQFPEKCDTCSSYYPHKDTFNLGDTLWIKMKIPKLFPAGSCGYYEFKKDSIYTCLLIGFDKNIDSLGFKAIYLLPRHFKKGSAYNNFYYFEYDDVKDYYTNEFGIVLNDTGTIYIGERGGYGLYIFVEENINPLSRKRIINGFYTSPFVETGKGYFNIYVKP